MTNEKMLQIIEGLLSEDIKIYQLDKIKKELLAEITADKVAKSGGRSEKTRYNAVKKFIKETPSHLSMSGIKEVEDGFVVCDGYIAAIIRNLTSEGLERNSNPRFINVQDILQKTKKDTKLIEFDDAMFQEKLALYKAKKIKKGEYPKPECLVKIEDTYFNPAMIQKLLSVIGNVKEFYVNYNKLGASYIIGESGEGIVLPVRVPQE